MLKVIDNHVVNIAEIIAVKRIFFDAGIFLRGGSVLTLHLSNEDYEVLLNYIRDYSLSEQHQPH